MKISELSAASGRSVATIKFFVREGLLPPGRRTAATRADYTDDHLRRLQLITTLTDIGGLPLGAVRDVLAAIDDDATSWHDMLGVAHHALTLRATTTPHATPEMEAAAAEIEAFIAQRGWQVKPAAPAITTLAGVLVALRALGWRVGADVLAPYAAAVDELAAWELAHTPAGGSRTRAVESIVVGTVVFETALCALRRLAEEHHSAMRNQT
jgi:DNA-binding transcriptional MerR regulator